MCEHDDLEDFARRADVSRRRFGVMALGAALAAMLPRFAGRIRRTSTTSR